RAARRLWARVLELSGVDADGRRSPTYARTSDRMLAGVDPWTNMLRATTAGFAAAVGGADGLTVAPFDTVVADAVGA
ncbi:methylmalonyl-CoA mutase family protein, partial [Escherichia coli]|nr:methylmalonyl-CoA mutase family protein [Escherichia coli]